MMFILLLFPVDSNVMALTQDSQKILNNYHNYEQSGSHPTTSQPYSPNTPSSEINAVPVPKTNVVTPTTQSSYYSQSQSQPTYSFPSGQMTQPWIIILVVLLVILAGVTGAAKQRRSTSYNRPPSMKQLAILRNIRYNGPMPTSSREAWDIIADIKKRGSFRF